MDFTHLLGFAVNRLYYKSKSKSKNKIRLAAYSSVQLSAGEHDHVGYKVSGSLKNRGKEGEGASLPCWASLHFF